MKTNKFVAYWNGSDSDPEVSFTAKEDWRVVYLTLEEIPEATAFKKYEDMSKLKNEAKRVLASLNKIKF